MLKISYAACLGHSLAISSQFTFKMCTAAKHRKKSQSPYSEDRSRSSMLIAPESWSPVLVVLSSKSAYLQPFSR